MMYLTIHGTYKIHPVEKSALSGALRQSCIGLGQQATFPIPLPLPVLSYFLTKVLEGGDWFGADLPQTFLFFSFFFFLFFLFLSKVLSW